MIERLTDEQLLYLLKQVDIQAMRIPSGVRKLADLICEKIQGEALPEGWKEATIAWEVCASIHREYAKKKDPFFTTRQADFVRHTEAARAALLAHIQRGAVPEGWQLVPKEPTPEMLAGGWGYWLNVMAPGKQRDTAAKEYTAMLAAAPAPDQFRDAAKMMAVQPCVETFDVDFLARLGAEVPTTAEVPMPEPTVSTYEGYRDSAGVWHPMAYSADQMRTYGAACRDAGYARGVDACIAALVALKPKSGVNGDGSNWLVRISKQDCVEACAALRGEVK